MKSGYLWAGFTSVIQHCLSVFVLGFWLVGIFLFLAFLVCGDFFFFFIHMLNQKMTEGFENRHTQCPFSVTAFRSSFQWHFTISTINWNWWNVCGVQILCLLWSPICILFGQNIFVIHSVWISCMSQFEIRKAQIPKGLRLPVTMGRM